jgi:hypothetical protein
MQIKLNASTLKFIEKAIDLTRKQHSNFNKIFALFESKDCPLDGKFSHDALNAGIVCLGAGTELLVMQILENLKKEFVLIALLGERTLFESSVNVRYIFHHPQHLHEKKWVDSVCKDFLSRPYDESALKSRLGEVSVAKRAKETNLLSMYETYYEELSNFVHFLGNVTGHIEQDAIQYYAAFSALHTAQMHREIIMTLGHYFEVEGIDEHEEDFICLQGELEPLIKNLERFKSVKGSTLCTACKQKFNEITRKAVLIDEVKSSGAK